MVTDDRLYELVERGRNDALHLGAAARHLTANAIDLSLRVEEVLSMATSSVRDFMVLNPVCGELWQPLQFIRKTMLENSFSYLPVCEAVEGGKSTWWLISDYALASYLGRKDHSQRQNRLKASLADALLDYDAKSQLLLKTRPITPDDDVSVVLQSMHPMLVCDGGDASRLVGIITAFDIL